MKARLISSNTPTIPWIGGLGVRRLLRQQRQRISLCFYLLGIRRLVIVTTCHWCHVMSHETFEDEEVARRLKQDFISIKVDREERPDIDSVYMSACQALTGGGGWPLTVFLTPDKRPFFAGTYFPKNRKYGKVGFFELLETISGQWISNRDYLLRAGDEITRVLTSKDNGGLEEQTHYNETPDIAFRALSYSFDRIYGGFGEAPKFPAPHKLMFLIRLYILKENVNALSMAEKTLNAMASGGIFDQIGYGFSRYSTDSKWLAPHFEKMLYDNALISIALIECYQATGRYLYRDITEKTLQFITRDLGAREGGFFSALDADSGGIEGKFYTFTPGEIKNVLGEKDGAAFCARYGVTPEGNFEGKSIPNLIGQDAAYMDDGEMETLRSSLYEYRLARESLHRDEKILTAWNALAITAFAKASTVFKSDDYLKQARQCFDFLLRELRNETGLMISRSKGQSRGQGLLDDYAFLIWACLSLYEACFEPYYISTARELASEILERFKDPAGGYFMNASDSEELIFRPKESYDGAMPSGNSVFALCLGKLGTLLREKRFEEEFEEQLIFFSSAFANAAHHHCFALLALMDSLYPKNELICVLGSKTDPVWIGRELAQYPVSSLSVVVKTPENAHILAEIAPHTIDFKPCGQEAESYYLCRGTNCLPPVHSLPELMRLLDLDIKEASLSTV